MKDANHIPSKRIKLDSNKGDISRSNVNEYTGWKVPSSNFEIETITQENDEKINAKQFFDSYVSQRKPVVLRSYVQDDLSKLIEWKKSNELLKKLAGTEQVMVEQRSATNDSFGRGNEVSLIFSEFLDLIEKGDSLHYLTTQDVECNADGQPDLMAPFMKSLSEHFPVRPKLMGNLIPQNINIWMGNSKNDGSSSGLHHDYHDNLYIVLRGKKKFRLYSPHDTEKMYTRGKLLKVHPNGRINYEGDETTAYGTDLKSDDAAKASRAKEYAEKLLIEAEKALLEGKPGAEKELEKAEEMLEEAMDALIDAEREDHHSDEEECDLFTPQERNPDEYLIDEDGFDCVDGNDSQDKCIEKKTDDQSKMAVRRLVDKTVKNPDNFSKISPHLLANTSQLLKEYPAILKATAAFCELEAGDILYLPASWFHEVTSFGEDKHLMEGNETVLGHLATNYWFHPPDNLHDFENPYSTDFWPNDYKVRLGKKN